MSESPLRARLIRNTLFGIASHVWGLLVAFVVTPILIAYVGLDLYGVYVFFGAITAWLWILDLGLTDSAARTFSRLAALRDEDGFNRALASSLRVKLAVAAVLVPAAWFLADPLVRVLAFPHPGISARAFQILTWTFALANFASIPAAALTGNQRHDLVYSAYLGTSIPGTVVSVVLLVRGYGLLPYLWVQFAWIAASALLGWILLARYVPWSRPFASGGGALADLFRYARAMTLCRLTDSLFLNADRILVGATTANPQLVSHYQLGASIATKAREGTLTLLASSMPAAADLHARGEEEALSKLVRRGTRYVCLVAAPIYLFAVVFAEEALRLWLGQVPPDSATVLRILAAGHFLSLVAAAPQALGQAAGRLRLQVVAGLLGAGLSISMYLLVGRLHGLPGLAVSVAAGLGVSSASYLIFFLRAFPGTFAWGSVFRPVAAACIAGLVLAPAKWLVVTRHWADTRGTAAISLAVTGLAAFGVLWIVGRHLRAIETYDVDTFVRRSP